jgi:DNA-binding NarL/FixJ family response regulator
VLEDIYREFVEEAAAIRAESREQSARVSELMEQRLRAIEERVERLEQALGELRLVVESTAAAGSSDMPTTGLPASGERFERADRWDDRYLEIVAYLHAGLDAREVAERLQVDVGTVEQVRQVLTAPPYPAQ